MMMQKNHWKRIWNIGSTALVALLVVIAILFVGIRFVGLTPYVVLSGSMEPEYPVGSLIYTKAVNPESIEAGDPITFVMNEELQVATHRVVETNSEEQYFRTKGDANDAIDGQPVHFNNLLGTPVFVIPLLGYAANFVSQPPGVYLAIAVMVSVLILLFLGSWLEKEPETQENPTA